MVLELFDFFKRKLKGSNLASKTVWRLEKWCGVRSLGICALGEMLANKKHGSPEREMDHMVRPAGCIIYAACIV